MFFNILTAMAHFLFGNHFQTQSDDHLVHFFRWHIKTHPFPSSIPSCLAANSSTSSSQHTHTHPFNGPFSGTTQVSRYQKGKTNLDFTEARDSEWQWHQLGHMQVCISLQRDNHTSTPPLKFFTGRMPFLLPNQQHQSTKGIEASSSQCDCKCNSYLLTDKLLTSVAHKISLKN